MYFVKKKLAQLKFSTKNLKKKPYKFTYKVIIQKQLPLSVTFLS